MQSIERNFNNPVFFDETIEEGCFFENTFVGIGTLIIDKEFISEMEGLADTLKDNKDLVVLTSMMHNSINGYYNSNNENKSDRATTYDDNLVVDEEGMVMGTKISSLKGKNIAKCSEKSLAAYVMLKRLHDGGIMKRKPELVLSNLSAGDSKAEPHAFVILNSEGDVKIPHILFDPENPTQLENPDGNKSYAVGLYVLSNEDYELLQNGFKCKPVSLFEAFGNCHEVGEQRIYGQNDQVVRN